MLQLPDQMNEGRKKENNCAAKRRAQTTAQILRLQTAK